MRVTKVQSHYIEAEDEQSEMLIARHCEAIERFGLPLARGATVDQLRMTN